VPPFLIVKHQPILDTLLGLSDSVVGLEISFLVFQAAPTALNIKGIHPASLAVDPTQRPSALAKKSILQRQLADLGMQVLQVSFIGCVVLLTTAEHSIGLVKQLFSPVLNLILVYVKLLPKLRQYPVALHRRQRDLGFTSGQMVSSFTSHNLLL
jgi:hypothetical protein